MSWTSTCASCGAPRDAADRFCAACGAANPQGAAPATGQPDVAPTGAPRPVAPPAPPSVAAPTPPPVAAAVPPPLPRAVAAMPPPAQAGAPAAPYATNAAAGASDPFDAKGLFRSLYDFKFTSFIATKVIRFIYAVLVVVYSIVGVIWLLLCIASGNAIVILLGLIFVPVSYLIYLILLRIGTELVMVFFKMGGDVHAIRYGTTDPGPGAS
jgi:hypothetical protein